jgi:hypothetical protein
MSTISPNQRQPEGFTKAELRSEVERAVRDIQAPLQSISRTVKKLPLQIKVTESIRILTEDILECIDDICPDVVRSCGDFRKTRNKVETTLGNANALLKQAGDPSGNKATVSRLIKRVKEWATERLSAPEGSDFVDENDDELQAEVAVDEVVVETEKEAKSDAPNKPEVAQTLTQLLTDLGIDEADHSDFIRTKCMTLASSYYWAFLMELSERAPFNTAEEIPDLLPKAIHLLYIHMRDALAAATHVSKLSDFASLHAGIVAAFSSDAFKIPFLDSGTVATFEKSVLTPVQNIVSAQSDSETFVLWLMDMDDPVDDFSTLDNVLSVLLSNKPKVVAEQISSEQITEVPLHEYEKGWIHAKLPWGKLDAMKAIRKNRAQLRAWAKQMKQDIQVDALPLRTFEFMQQLIDAIVLEEVAKAALIEPEREPAVALPGVDNTVNVTNEAVDAVDGTEAGTVVEVAAITIDEAEVSKDLDEPTTAERKALLLAPRVILKVHMADLLQEANVGRVESGLSLRTEEWVRRWMAHIRPGTKCIQSATSIPSDAEIGEAVRVLQVLGIRPGEAVTNDIRQRAWERMCSTLFMEVDDADAERAYRNRLINLALERMKAASPIQEDAPVPALLNVMNDGDVPTSGEKEIIAKMTRHSSVITDVLITAILTAINTKRAPKSLALRTQTWLRQVMNVPVIESIAESPEDEDKQVEILSEAADPFADLLLELARGNSVRALLETECDPEELEELVTDLSVLHGAIGKPLDTIVVRDLLLRSLEYHCVVNHVDFAVRKNNPNGWMIGAVRNAVYQKELPPGRLGWEIKDAISWLLKELTLQHAVLLADYSAYRERLAQERISHKAIPPVARVSPVVVIDQPVETVEVAAEGETVTAVADTQAPVEVPVTKIESASDTVPDEVTTEVVETVGEPVFLVAETDGETVMPLHGAGEDALMPSDADVPIEDSDAQLWNTWRQELRLKMKEALHTPQLLDDSMRELLSQMDTLEQEFETLMDEMDECLSSEKNAFCYVQSAHIFSLNKRKGLTDLHFSLDKFEPNVDILRRHEARTKVIRLLKGELQKMEDVIQAKRGVINIAKNFLNLVRSEVLNVPLQSIGANVHMQIVAPASQIEASEKLRELQAQFKGLWEDHISIRTNDHPVDLPEGSIDDIFLRAKEAFEIFSGSEPKPTSILPKTKKSEPDGGKRSVDAFPSLTPLQQHCVQMLTAQTSTKRDLRSYTWGFTVEKMQRYWSTVFPGEAVPTIEEIELSLKDSQLSEEHIGDSVLRPTLEMRQTQKLILIWMKKYGGKENTLYMPTYMAYEWSDQSSGSIAGQPLTNFIVLRNSEREATQREKEQRTKRKPGAKKPKKKKT